MRLAYAVPATIISLYVFVLIRLPARVLGNFVAVATVLVTRAANAVLAFHPRFAFLQASERASTKSGSYENDWPGRNAIAATVGMGARMWASWRR